MTEQPVSRCGITCNGDINDSGGRSRTLAPYCYINFPHSPQTLGRSALRYLHGRAYSRSGRVLCVGLCCMVISTGLARYASFYGFTPYYEIVWWIFRVFFLLYFLLLCADWTAFQCDTACAMNISPYVENVNFHIYDIFAVGVFAKFHFASIVSRIEHLFSHQIVLHSLTFLRVVRRLILVRILWVVFKRSDDHDLIVKDFNSEIFL